MGNSPNAAPYAAELRVSETGMRYPASATSNAEPRPHKPATHAGFRLTPSRNSNTAIGSAATIAEMARLCPQMEYPWAQAVFMRGSFLDHLRAKRSRRLQLNRKVDELDHTSCAQMRN